METRAVGFRGQLPVEQEQVQRQKHPDDPGHCETRRAVRDCPPKTLFHYKNITNNARKAVSRIMTAPRVVDQLEDSGQMHGKET